MLPSRNKNVFCFLHISISFPPMPCIILIRKRTTQHLETSIHSSYRYMHALFKADYSISIYLVIFFFFFQKDIFLIWNLDTCKGFSGINFQYRYLFYVIFVYVISYWMSVVIDNERYFKFSKIYWYIHFHVCVFPLFCFHTYIFSFMPMGVCDLCITYMHL